MNLLLPSSAQQQQQVQKQQDQRQKPPPEAVLKPSEIRSVLPTTASCSDRYTRKKQSVTIKERTSENYDRWQWADNKYSR